MKTGLSLTAGLLAVVLSSAVSATAAPLSVSVLGGATNCKADGTPANPSLKIAFAQTDLATPWRVTELRSFELWAKKLCVTHFIWNEANEDVAKQLTNVANLIAQRPNALVLDPEADQPLLPTIKMASAAKIPMVVIDRKLSAAPGPNSYAAYIGADNYLVGFASATAWIEKLKKDQKTDQPKANAVIIMGGVGQDPANERNRGVQSAVRPYSGIKIVDIQSGDWTRAGGRKVMQAYIQHYPSGTLQGAFTASDEEMIGARQALQAANRTDLDGWFFSGDGQLQGLQAVGDGFDVADTQFPPLYGKPSLEAAIALSQGKTLPATSFTLDLKTFTCLTDAACQQTKAYIAQLQATGLQF